MVDTLFVVAFFTALTFSFTNCLPEKSCHGSSIKFTLDNYKNLLAVNWKDFDQRYWDSLGITILWTVVMSIGNNLDN